VRDLSAADWLFLGGFQLFACLIRYRFMRERAEMRRLVRLTGQVVTLVLLAAPLLFVVGALTGRLECSGPPC
jgi:hypothetical protein